MIEAVRSFLTFIQDTDPNEKPSLKRLAELLDRLLVAYHESSDAAPATETQPTSGDYETWRGLVQAAAYPNRGSPRHPRAVAQWTLATSTRVTNGFTPPQ